MKTTAKMGRVVLGVGALVTMAGCAAGSVGTVDPASSDGTPPSNEASPAGTVGRQPGRVRTEFMKSYSNGLVSGPTAFALPSGVTYGYQQLQFTNDYGVTTGSPAWVTFSISGLGQPYVPLGSGWLASPFWIAAASGACAYSAFTPTAGGYQPNAGSFTLQPGQTCTLTIGFEEPWYEANGSSEPSYPSGTCFEAGSNCTWSEVTTPQEYDAALAMTVTSPGCLSASPTGCTSGLPNWSTTTTVPLTGVTGAATGTRTVSLSASMDAVMNGAAAPAPPLSGTSHPAEPAGWNSNNEFLTYLVGAGCTGPIWAEANAGSRSSWFLASMCPAIVPNLTAPVSETQSASNGFGATFTGPILVPEANFKLLPVFSSGMLMSQFVAEFGPTSAYVADALLDYSGSSPIAIPAPSGYVFVYFNDPNGCTGASCSPMKTVF